MRLICAAFVIACCASIAQPAAALDRTEYNSAVKIYFGGSTNLDSVLEAAFTSSTYGICDPVLGDIDIWRATGQLVITCRASNDNTPNHGFLNRSQGGTLIAFHKESEGGSSNAVTPLILVAKGQPHTLRWLELWQLSNDCTVTSVGPTQFFQAYTSHTDCELRRTPFDTAASTTYDVHGGISDIEPALAYPDPGADAARIKTDAGSVIMYGVPVTNSLYRALQVAQFGDGSACDGSDLPNCIPSLTRAQIAGLYAQSIYEWSQFKNAAGTSLTAIAGVTPPTDPYVRICRRVAASGAQAVTEAYFLKGGCTSSASPFALPDDNSTVEDVQYMPPSFHDGTLVNASPNAANVRSCLRTANEQNFWGMGVHSMQLTDAEWVGNDGVIRFIAINGATPTLVNVANGDYDFFAETTINRISDTYPGNAGAIADGHPRREVIELLNERFGNVALLSQINSVVDNRPWGNAGLLARANTSTGPNYTAPYSGAQLAATPVATQSRNGNTCAPAVVTKSQPINGTPNP